MSGGEAFIDIEAVFIRKRRDLEAQILKRVRCPHTAADLATDMYIKLKRINPPIATTNEAWTYLHRMAVSMAIDYIRVTRGRKNLLGKVVDLLQPEQEPPADRKVIAQDQLNIVSGALSELPEKVRQILLLSRVAGLTHDQIAKQLGVSKSLVEKYVARALLHCRQRMVEVAEREAEREADLGGKDEDLAKLGHG